jgi:formate dehydrogenase iron-sulfur subunit
MHCTNAACVKVCPNGTLAYDGQGAVSLNPDTCTGCGYCVDFCPFQVPRSRRNLLSGIAKASKCTLCTSPGLNRLAEGQKPACVKSCPPGALDFGDRAAMLDKAKARVLALKAAGNPNANLYGENELGGLHVLYVLKHAPSVYGLPTNPVFPEVATAWKSIIQPLGWAVGGLTLIGLGLNFLVAREAKMSRELPGKKKEGK